MLSKNKIKLIRTLDSKKSRLENKLFVAEGEKLVSEILISGMHILYLAATEDWFEANRNIPLNCREKDIVTQDELTKASFLKTPQKVLCLVALPSYPLHLDLLKDRLSLILDNIQDPGNLGTIIRIADWFGIENIICSPDTADAFNPKVVQSTMGAICRVKIHYQELEFILSEIKSRKMPLFGTTLSGENINTAALSDHGFIVMGNESKGMNPAWIPMLDKELFIPFFPHDKKRSESLNVAVATGIICSEFRRRPKSNS